MNLHSTELSKGFNRLCILFEKLLIEAQLITFHELIDVQSETSSDKMRAAYKVRFNDEAALMAELQT